MLAWHELTQSPVNDWPSQANETDCADLSFNEAVKHYPACSHLNIDQVSQ